MTLVEPSAQGLSAAHLSAARRSPFGVIAQPLPRLNHRRRHVDLQRVASALCCS
ncbi:MAG: putative leader peptide [Nakamurella sp.]